MYTQSAYAGDIRHGVLALIPTEIEMLTKTVSFRTLSFLVLAILASSVLFRRLLHTYTHSIVYSREAAVIKFASSIGLCCFCCRILCLDLFTLNIYCVVGVSGYALAVAYD